MKQKYFHVFEDNIIVEFNLNTDTRKMELYLEDYWDKEKRETVFSPVASPYLHGKRRHG